MLRKRASRTPRLRRRSGRPPGSTSSSPACPHGCALGGIKNRRTTTVGGKDSGIHQTRDHCSSTATSGWTSKPRGGRRSRGRRDKGSRDGCWQTTGVARLSLTSYATPTWVERLLQWRNYESEVRLRERRNMRSSDPRASGLISVLFVVSLVKNKCREHSG